MSILTFTGGDIPSPILCLRPTILRRIRISLVIWKAVGYPTSKIAILAMAMVLVTPELVDSGIVVATIKPGGAATGNFFRNASRLGI
jgi:hypothetical protein